MTPTTDLREEAPDVQTVEVCPEFLAEYVRENYFRWWSTKGKPAIKWTDDGLWMWIPSRLIYDQRDIEPVYSTPSRTGDAFWPILPGNANLTHDEVMESGKVEVSSDRLQRGFEWIHKEPESFSDWFIAEWFHNQSGKPLHPYQPPTPRIFSSLTCSIDPYENAKAKSAASGWKRPAPISTMVDLARLAHKYDPIQFRVTFPAKLVAITCSVHRDGEQCPSTIQSTQGSKFICKNHPRTVAKRTSIELFKQRVDKATAEAGIEHDAARAKKVEEWNLELDNFRFYDSGGTPEATNHIGVGSSSGDWTPNNELRQVAIFARRNDEARAAEKDKYAPRGAETSIERPAHLVKIVEPYSEILALFTVPNPYVTAVDDKWKGNVYKKLFLQWLKDRKLVIDNYFDSIDEAKAGLPDTTYWYGKLMKDQFEVEPPRPSKSWDYSRTISGEPMWFNHKGSSDWKADTREVTGPDPEYNTVQDGFDQTFDKGIVWTKETDSRVTERHERKYFENGQDRTSKRFAIDVDSHMIEYEWVN